MGGNFPIPIPLVQAVFQAGRTPFHPARPHAIHVFLEQTFRYARLDWAKYVQLGLRYLLPTEVALPISAASKARRQLGWEPKVKVRGLDKLVADAGLEWLQAHRQGQIKATR